MNNGFPAIWLKNNQSSTKTPKKTPSDHQKPHVQAKGRPQQRDQLKRPKSSFRDAESRNKRGQPQSEKSCLQPADKPPPKGLPQPQTTDFKSAWTSYHEIASFIPDPPRSTFELKMAFDTLSRLTAVKMTTIQTIIQTSGLNGCLCAIEKLLLALGKGHEIRHPDAWFVKVAGS